MENKYLRLQGLAATINRVQDELERLLLHKTNPSLAQRTEEQLRKQQADLEKELTETK